MPDVDSLADRLKRISDLTDELTKAQQDHAKAHDLAVRIGREIAAARQQIQQLPAEEMREPPLTKGFRAFDGFRHAA